jgi:hypothetical protein
VTSKGDTHDQVLVNDGSIWGWKDIRGQVVYEETGIKGRAMEDTKALIRIGDKLTERHGKISLEG